MALILTKPTIGSTDWGTAMNSNLDKIMVASGYIVAKDYKPSGTSGGAFTSGAWQRRVLNTLETDTLGVASLASNAMILPAGTYQCQASAPAFRVGSHQTRLRNINLSTTLVIGCTAFAESRSYGDVSRSFLSGRFTLATPASVCVEHRCTASNSTHGFGLASSFDIPGLYTVLEIWST